MLRKRPLEGSQGIFDRSDSRSAYRLQLQRCSILDAEMFNHLRCEWDHKPFGCLLHSRNHACSLRGQSELTKGEATSHGVRLLPFWIAATMAPTSRTHKLPFDAATAVEALAAADPRLGRLIGLAGPFTLRLPAQQSPFEALLRSILYQQLHGKAAAAIHRKLLASFQPDAAAALLAGLPVNSSLGAPLLRHPSAQEILDCPNEQLRAAGLSANKALAIRDLASKTLDGTVPSLARIRRMSDENIIEHLTEVRGIGRWTVEMFLMFRLGRPDVLPTSDYGVRKGFALTFQGLKPDTKVTPDLLAAPAAMELRARRWQPWR